MANLHNKVVSRIDLYADSAASSKPTFIYAKQYDAKSRYIVATIKSLSGSITISGTVQLNATKPDGTSCYLYGEINGDNSVTFELTSQLLSVVGVVSCDVTVLSSSGTSPASLTTSTFFIVVEESNYNADAIESENQYTVLEETIERLSKLKPKIVNLVLKASNWVGSKSPYYQPVELGGVTSNSKVDLQLCYDVLMSDITVSFIAANDNGSVKIYAVGDLPKQDYTIQATITEASI
jgi:hypothetical protein